MASIYDALLEEPAVQSSPYDALLEEEPAPAASPYDALLDETPAAVAPVSASPLGSPGPVGSLDEGKAPKPAAPVAPRLSAGEAVTGISEGVTAAASTKPLAANLGREFLGGAAGAAADIVGGAARTAADVMTGGSERPEIQKWEKKVMDISQKRSVRDDYTPQEIANMTEAPPGYRSPKEEVDLEVAKWHLGNLRGREQGAKMVREPLEDIQRLSSLASEESKTFFGQDPARQDEFLSHLAAGAGSLPPYIASAMAGGPGLSMLTGALQTGQNEYNAAIESGHPELADEAMAKGLSIGLSEGAGVGGGFSAPAKAYGEKALKVLLKGFEEGGQEWVQQVLSNLNASTFTGYDKGRQVGQGAGEAALIGFLLGGGAESLGQLRKGESAAEAPTVAAPDISAEDAARRAAKTASTTATGQQVFMEPALQRDTLDGLVKTRQALARDIDQQSAATQAVRQQSIAEIDTQLERYGPEAVREAEARTAAPAPPPIAGVPPAPTEAPGGPSPQDSAAQAAAQLSQTAAASAETLPLAAAEAAKLASDVQQSAAPRRVRGPALIDPEGKILIEGTIGQTHAQLKLEAAKRGIDATEGEHVFLDESGTPMNRYLAASVADAAGQRAPGIGGPLQSEHLTVETTPAPPSPEAAAPPAAQETPTPTATPETIPTTIAPSTPGTQGASELVAPSQGPAISSNEPLVVESETSTTGAAPVAAPTSQVGTPETTPQTAPVETKAEPHSSPKAATSAPVRLSAKAMEDFESAPEPAEAPAKPAEPAMRIVPAGKKRFKIVNAADEQVGKRTYTTQARAELALSKIGKKSPFNLPPSDDGNDIIDAIIEEGGVNLSGMSKEERENVFPHKGIWRNALTTDNPNATPSGVAALLAPSQEKIDVGEMSYGDGDERTMFDLINQAVAARKKRRGERIYEASVRKTGERKALAFEAAISDESPGEEAVAVSELKMGDVVLINGEECTVVNIDADTGDVTFKDGKKFGQQTVEDGRIIYAEIVEDIAAINKEIDVAADAARIASEESADAYIARHKLEEAELSAGGIGEEEPGGAPDAKGKEGAADTPSGALRPTTPKAETPLERARRIVATQEANQILARQEEDYELAASLERVLPKLRRDLAAEEAKAAKATPEATLEVTPEVAAPPVEMWQRKREAVGEQLAKHREAVKNAVAKKLPVPDEVLAEYSGAPWADKEIARRNREEKKAAKAVAKEAQAVTTEPEAVIEPPTKEPPTDLLTADTTNTGTSANVTNEDAGTLVRVGGQVVAKLNQNKAGEFVPELNDAGQKLTAEQKALVDTAAKDYTKTWRAAKVREGAAKSLAGADVTTQLDMLETGKSETPLFEQPSTEKPKDKFEAFLDDTIKKLDSKPGELFADPLFIKSVGMPALKAAVKVVRLAYIGGRSVVEAIAEGMAYLRANVPNLDEAKAQEFFESFYEQEEAPQPTPTALPDTTAAYNAETDKLLTASGFEPIAAPVRKALGESWDQAKAIVDNDPGRGSRLVAELNENPRTLEDDVESGVLLHELAKRKAEQARAQEALFKANESGDQTSIDDANVRFRDALRATYEAITAAKATGTAWGRAGRFRQVHIDQDFSLVAMQAAWRSEANKGKELSKAQIEMIAELRKRIDDSEKKLEEYRQKEEAAEAKRVYDELIREAKKEASAVKKTGGGITSYIHDQAQKAKERIIARRGKLFATIDPLNIAGLVDEAIIGADYIAQGITKLADWSAKMLDTFGERLKPMLPALFDKSKEYHDSVSESIGKGPSTETPADVLAGAVPDEPLDPRLVFNLARAHVNAGVEGMENVMKAVHDDLVQIYPELTEREVRDAFSGYGKKTYPSKEEDLTKLREYRNLARLTSQLEDAERRVVPLKTGPQRDKASAKVRELTKAVKEMVRKMGLNTSDSGQLRTSLDAIKTRLKNQIEDIGKQIATKTKPPGRTPIPYDAEASELRAERDRLQAISDEIFGKPQQTDAQRIAAATKALDRAIAEEDAMLKAGILKRAPKAAKTPSTPELEAKRFMLDAMRDLRRDLNDAANPKASPEEKALEAALKSAQASIDLYKEMLKSGNLKSPDKAPKFSPTDELETLWSQRNALRDAVNELRAASRPKASKEESARKAAIKALDKRLAELDRRIRTGDFSAAPKAPSKASAFADVQKKRADVAELRKVYEAMRKATLPKRTEEEIRLARDKKMIANRTAELERRIAAKDYAPKPKKPPVMDKEKADLLYENAKAKEAFTKALFEETLRQRTFGRKVFDTAREVLNTSRAVLTSMDLSGVLRQGGFIAFAHPVRAAKSIVPMLKAFASEKSAKMAEQEIQSRPNAGLYDTSKLYLADQNSHSLTKQEEAFMSRWANKIPLVAGSQRAYTTFLNKLRADSFDAMAKSLGSGATLTPEEGKAIANFINVATGRGSIPGKAAQAAAGLNSIFFAPRFVISRFQLLAGQPFYGGNARTRALIAGEYARYLAGVALVYALAGLDPDKDDLVTDPTSSDFLKLKWGGTRLDPMSGLLQATVFGAREWGAVKRFVTQDKSKEPKYGSGGDVLGRFLRSKLSPAIGAVVDALAHKDVTGQEVTPESTLKRMVTPLSFGDILKTMEEQGVPRGTALSVLALFGMGLQTYADKKKVATPSYR